MAGLAGIVAVVRRRQEVVRGCRNRRLVLGDALGCGKHARVFGEAGGGERLPESASERRRRQSQYKAKFCGLGACLGKETKGK